MSDTYPELSEGMDLDVHAVLSSLPISDRKMKEIKANTEQDPQMDQLKQVILKGWPNERHLCPVQVLDYWNFRDKLTVVGSLNVEGPENRNSECFKTKDAKNITPRTFWLQKNPPQSKR